MSSRERRRHPLSDPATPARARTARGSIGRVLEMIGREVRGRTPAVEAAAPRTPYRVLVSCLISLRTRDAVTDAASSRLFARADTPAAMVRVRETTIARWIYPCGFYRTKARQIRALSRRLLDEWEGRVPDTIEALLSLPGVGRKTANLVVTLGYGKHGICVDTHVHRILNRIGYVRTDSPDQTERVLRRKLPREHWISINGRLVRFGQYRCTPISPHCSDCPVRVACRRIGVHRHR